MQTQETLVASLALQQVREASGIKTQEEVTTECTCKIKIYIILALTVTIFGLVILAALCSRKLKLCRGCMFSNAVKIMLFISDVQYYVLINCVKLQGASIYSKLQARKTRKCKIKLKIYLGYYRNRLKEGQHDF